MIASAVWLAEELTKSSVIAVTTKAAMKLKQYLTGIPVNAKKLESYDKAAIVQAVSELSSLDQDLSFAINQVVKCNDKQLLTKLQLSRQTLERLRDAIEFSQHFEIKRNEDHRGLAYIDSMLLAKCFAVSEATKNTFAQETETQDLTIFLKNLDNEFRNIDRIAHIRSLAIELPLNQLLKIIEAENPRLYESIKSIALFALSIESEKKGLLTRGQYYKKMSARTLLVANHLETNRPYVGLKEFFLEFQKSNPDLMEVQFNDIEKSLALLQQEGWISRLSRQPDGNKIVIFKLDDKRALEIVHNNDELQKNGVTSEELALRTGWSVDYSRQVLDNMEETGTSRRVIGDDGLLKWYFPNEFIKTTMRQTN